MTDPMPGLRWWQSGIIYQIYPRSFQDSNDDGVGDLAGILSRLDYLVSLGIDAVWLSPIYPSPMADCGYDISDYVGIDPLFGTLAGFDRLCAALHARGLKLILDFVPNHSSDKHPWFIDSASSRHSPRRDWYIWRDGAPDGGPPNNWQSEFGGSAWELDRRGRLRLAVSVLPHRTLMVTANADSKCRSKKSRASVRSPARTHRQFPANAGRP